MYMRSALRLTAIVIIKKTKASLRSVVFVVGHRGYFISRTGEGRVEILAGMLIISLRGVHQGFWSPYGWNTTNF